MRLIVVCGVAAVCVVCCGIGLWCGVGLVLCLRFAFSGQCVGGNFLLVGLCNGLYSCSLGGSGIGGSLIILLVGEGFASPHGTCACHGTYK